MLTAFLVPVKRRKSAIRRGVSAEAAKCDFLLTTDNRLIRRAGRAGSLIGCKVLNPVNSSRKLVREEGENGHLFLHCEIFPQIAEGGIEGELPRIEELLVIDPIPESGL